MGKSNIIKTRTYTNVQFGEQCIRIQHSGLSLEIPDTINVRTAETERGLIPLVMPFLYFDSSVYLLQYSAPGDFFEAYRPYFDEMINGIHVII